MLAPQNYRVTGFGDTAGAPFVINRDLAALVVAPDSEWDGCMVTSPSFSTARPLTIKAPMLYALKGPILLTPLVPIRTADAANYGALLSVDGFECAPHWVPTWRAPYRWRGTFTSGTYTAGVVIQRWPAWGRQFCRFVLEGTSMNPTVWAQQVADLGNAFTHQAFGLNIGVTSITQIWDIWKTTTVWAHASDFFEFSLAANTPTVSVVVEFRDGTE